MATNPWMEHVKRFRAKNPNLEYKECLKRAKKSYKATGGAKKVRKSKQKGGQLDIDGNLLAQLQTYGITQKTFENLEIVLKNHGFTISDPKLFNKGMNEFLIKAKNGNINYDNAIIELTTIIMSKLIRTS